MLASAVLLCLVANAAASVCESWCSKWTCGNTNACGGCTASICQGPNPHAMCSDLSQPYCDAPRCDAWCSSSPTTHCGRVECQCDFCGVTTLSAPEPTAQVQARSSPAPARASLSTNGNCDADYLRRIKSELQQMIDGQAAKNAALKQVLAPGTVSPNPPLVVSAPSPPSPHPPPPPPCVALHTQCGGFNHVGATTCCAGMRCHVYSQYYSGCLPVSNNI
mmetsp:Transcript_22409/g.58916  ORF Transcript_22409/g.58916 Transcript_22409/m.58916 type:complete len:220 (+) Transcript_22409:27-686(+)